MFGLELWFVLAVMSAVVGGLWSFLHKVVVQKELDVYVVTFFSSAIPTLILIIGFFIWGDWAAFFAPMLFFAFIWGFLFSINLILKVEALRYIDAAIYFPIYKILGPLFVVVAGVVIFGEQFSILEWTGLVFSMLVPLILITKTENSRQKNLKLGLVILLIGSLLATAAAASAKQGVSLTNNVMAFLMAEYLFLTFSAFFLLLKKNGFQTMQHIRHSINKAGMVTNILLTGVLSFSGVALAHASLYFNGPLGIVYTINSLYILIPIVLSVIFYHEHWNARKVIAVFLSVAALVFLK